MMMVDELQFIEFKGTKDGWVEKLNQECAAGWRPVWSMMIEEPTSDSTKVLTLSFKFSVWMYRKYSTTHRLNLNGSGD
jgi:hypothetical protein